jgi:hypothetical protein
MHHFVTNVVIELLDATNETSRMRERQDAGR